MPTPKVVHKTGSRDWTITEGDRRITVVMEEDFAVINYWEKSVRGRFVMEETMAIPQDMVPMIIKAMGCKCS